MSRSHKSVSEHCLRGHEARKFPCAHPAASEGFSLVELMVGILVSLIGILAIMAAFSVYEGKKRTTTSGDDAQQNGSFALYDLERQVRSAGSGLVQGKNYSVWGCPITALTFAAMPAPFNNTALKLPATTQAVPVLIAAGGTSPDVISVVGGNPSQQVFKIGVTSAPTGGAVVVGNSFGILPNDYLLGTLANGTCQLGQAVTVTTASNSFTVAAATTTVTGLANSVNLFDLGPGPVFTLFGVDPTSNSLVSFDQLQRTANGGIGTLPIADGIVQMKALYGIHDGTGPTGESVYAVDKWVQPVGTTWGIGALTASATAAAAAATQIVAIRVAVVAQSRLPERASDYTGPATLTLFPDLPTADQYNIAVQTQYRYKIYDTTIPIRNAMIVQYY
ncbi:PilW family protein [Rhodanobacter hydrolyticus]|uniref:PilW family protein n=1 Tax=Rhodanobacter hydrolyticus TaxID=2250595 RepID=A0ABW8J5H1_9GAMM